MADNAQSILGFYGGAGAVTGANFMLETDGARILVDCGLTQGGDFCEDVNREDFAYDPSTVDVLIVTHAHIDHIGRIPKLVADGFNGPIYSTPPTKALAEIMFEDSLGILTEEAEKANKAPLYTREDVKAALELWQTVEYREEQSVGDVTWQFKDAGHILGSAMVEVNRSGRRIVFSGDLGSTEPPLEGQADTPAGANYLLTESVYGNREHEGMQERRHLLGEAVKRCVERGGTVVIPAFALERTQTLLYEIGALMREGVVPDVPVFLDSPLAIELTQVYAQFPEYMSDELQAAVADGDTPFRIPTLTRTESVEQSKQINDAPDPKIIIAGSGMSNAGRVQHHHMRYLPEEKNMVIFVGYQAPGSPGRQIQEGNDTVTIMGNDIPVKAERVTVEGYSAHRGSDGLLDFAASAGESLEHVYTAMGEPQAAQFLAQRIRDMLGVGTTVPGKGMRTTIRL